MRSELTDTGWSSKAYAVTKESVRVDMLDVHQEPLSITFRGAMRIENRRRLKQRFDSRRPVLSKQEMYRQCQSLHRHCIEFVMRYNTLVYATFLLSLAVYYYYLLLNYYYYFIFNLFIIVVGCSFFFLPNNNTK